MRRPIGTTPRWLVMIGVGLAVLVGSRARAQIPGLPPAPAPTAKADPGQPAPAPTKDNPEATVTTTTGSIVADEAVPDDKIRAKLEQLIPRYPGVRRVEVVVDGGVVTLEGQVENAEVRHQVTDVTRRIKGVSFIINLMKTDAQVMTAGEIAIMVLAGYRDTIARDWLLVVLALGIVLLFLALAKLFSRHAETLLSPLVKNGLLRSVLGPLVAGLLFILGVLLALNVLDLTKAVLSVVGLAGVVGLAVGFALRDIAENFIASVLLGLRRPFRVGDYVQVAGQAGIVWSLNTRATVLVTLEGKHVRIPNAIIYKEILINSTASPSVRGDFDMIIPHGASIATALDAVTRALQAHEGLLPEPPPRALVEELRADGVRLKAYFWFPSQGVDGFKIISDARLRAKVALQGAGIAHPTIGVILTTAGRVPVDLTGSNGQGPPAAAVPPASTVTPQQAKANLVHDSEAAAAASGESENGRATPEEHVLSEAGSAVSNEGENLINNKN